MRNCKVILYLWGVLWLLTACSSMNKHQNSRQLNLERSDFQTQINGKQTDLYILDGGSGIKMAVTNYGGRIVSLLVPDADGNFADIVLGFDHIQGYLDANEPYFGATIGRYANRINEGIFNLEGETYQLATNNGPNHLHGGPGGFHNVVWEAKQLSDTILRLRYVSEDGEEGYPGKLTVQVVYSITPDDEFRIEYSAFTDQKTVINLTNHAFFNLKGAGTGTINDHRLLINADYFTPIDSTLIPTGETAAVESTPFDFRIATPIGERVNHEHVQLDYGYGYDHNFVLNKPSGNEKLSMAARVTETGSGRTMEIYTTEPGLQFYGGNFLDGSDVGKGGQPYEYRTAFCLEPQHFPDSPNRPEFPSAVLNPGELYYSMSVYKFN